MGEKKIFSVILSVFVFCLCISSHTSHAEYKAPRHPAAPVCKDSALGIELSDLSEKMGIKLDSSCDVSLVETLSGWLGTPYHHAGYSKEGIDCSGFVSRIYKDVYGINLTHSSRSMIYQVKERVKKDDLQEGDILFFKIHGKRISHVAIYLQDGMFIHASLEKGITIDRLDNPYYKKRYYTAGRILVNDNKLATN